MIAYFDTSALVQLFLREPGTETVRDLWDGAADRVTSAATYPEARSAIASAARSGRVGRERAQSAVSELDERFATMSVVVLDGSLAVEAGELADLHALHGYDAVQLASALTLGEALVATWDADLAKAAQDSGLAVVSG
ncbi:MAG: type II toxin-antitoxin system VapC family toxin [Actinomycetota bacterium]